MLGVALGVAALITILSIMNGFEGELRDRILGMAAHIVVAAEHGALNGWFDVANQLEEHAGVVASAPFIQRGAMLTHYDKANGVVVRGVEPKLEGEISIIAQKMIEGELSALKSGAFNIILGRGLADTLHARVGSRPTLIAPEPVRTPAGMLPRLRRYTVVGIFEAGVHEYDTAVALIHIGDAAKMFRFGDTVSGLRVKVDDPFDAPQIAVDLRDELAGIVDTPLKFIDWTETNVNLFKALKTEKIVMFIILVLTIAVAAFNLVSTLVMVVSEKTTEIAILQTLGMTKRRILIIFLIHGGLIGAVGIVIGVTLGVALAVNVDTIVASVEQLFHFKIFSPEVYYISEIPSQLEWHDVIVAVLIAVALCFIAPLYPAFLASRTAPAQALRYD